MTTTAAPAPTRPDATPHHGPDVAETPPGPVVVLAGCLDDVPRELAPGTVVVLPGGFRMRAPGGAEPPGVVRPPADLPIPVTEPADAERARARAAELVRLVGEVLAGRRTPAQLDGVATPTVVRYLQAARPGSPVVRRGPGGPAGTSPGRATRLGSTARAGRVGAPGCGVAPERRTRVHVAHPHPDAAEVCATVPVAGRPRALALRLDRTGPAEPWRITATRLL
ncbi:Rv3235 family protein [Pseudonocardia nematodicida]|uniref:Rv3235 family protein n=1 Tax=Pseudonocardia nematodicida TaxID=1206997 RepID=A0ABV1KA32_9PSEU